MRKTLLLFFLPMLIACDKDNFKTENIITNMKKVADYELAHLSTHYSSDDQHNYPNGWVPSTFYVSLVPLFEATSDLKYMKEVKKWSSSNQWDCAPRFRHADDIVCGQIYLDYYRHNKKELYVSKLKNRMDSLMITAIPGRDDWHWCDALFMAPPVYMMAGSILKDASYQDYVNEMYWDVHDYLFDKEEALFFRDDNYFQKRSPNGNKLFWGRGNGWVIGGLARMIPYVMDETSKKKYIELFKIMSHQIIQQQQDDGLWRSNLLDADHYPEKETSASSFFVYALAWGINYGILDSETYLPHVSKGWNSLCECIDDETGMLGWVQPIGAAPGAASASTTMSYGAGAFVLAGTEILKLTNN